MGHCTAASHCKYSLHVHLIFICKERKHLLRGEIQPWMQEENHCLAPISKFEIESMESDKDHMYILLNYEPTPPPP
ncbi:MAG: transposase [Sphaerochaeta sp.]|nr:transposase [Sphaerochaeta sp.]